MPNNGLLSYCSPARTRVRKRIGRVFDGNEIREMLVDLDLTLAYVITYE